MLIQENSTSGQKFVQTTIRLELSIYEELKKRHLLAGRSFGSVVRKGLLRLIEESKKAESMKG